MKKYNLIFLCFALLIFFSCKRDDEINAAPNDNGGTGTPTDTTTDSTGTTTGDSSTGKYTVNIAVLPEGAGIVTPSGKNSYKSGDTVKVIAKANQGYSFESWDGVANASKIDTLNVIVDKDYDITVHFLAMKYKLTVTTDGNGSVILNPATKDSLYDYGTEVIVTAKADEGWGFKDWEAGLSGTKSPVQVKIESDSTIKAVFEQRKFYLADNGVTIKCPVAQVGESGVVNGITYTKRTKDQIEGDHSLASTSCTSGITDMNRMFTQDSTFNEDISSWDVSNVTDMGYVFYLASDFNRDVSHWDVSNVTSMRYMFAQDTLFNQDLSKWNVSNVTDMNSMLMYNYQFSSDLSSWDVGNVTDMENLFFKDAVFNSDLSGWDVSKVTKMKWMLYLAKSFNSDMSRWCVQNVSSKPENFAQWTQLVYQKESGYYPKWGTCP